MAVAVQIELNSKADRAFSESWIDYTWNAIGALRSLSLVRGGSRLFNEIVATPSSIAKELDKNAGIAMSGLGIVRLPSITRDAYTEILGLGTQDGKTGTAFRTTMDAVNSWASAGSFITGNPALRNIATIADLGYDASDLGLAVADYNQALVYEEASIGDAKEAFTHTRKYYMLRIAKAIISVVSAIFAVLLLFTGLKLLPVILAIFLSLAATMIAIRRDLFKDEGRFRLIDLSLPLLV